MHGQRRIVIILLGTPSFMEDEHFGNPDYSTP